MSDRTAPRRAGSITTLITYHLSLITLSLQNPMPAYVPAEVGMSLAEVDTPALILDLDAFERNLDRMDASLEGKKIRIRPHAKSHKCPEIALRQIAARRGRRVLPEGERGGSDGGRRRDRRADRERGGRRAEAEASGRAREARAHRSVRRRRGQRHGARRSRARRGREARRAGRGERRRQPLRRRAGRAGAPARASDCALEKPALRGASGLPGRGAAPAQGGGAARRDRGGVRARAGDDRNCSRTRALPASE